MGTNFDPLIKSFAVSSSKIEDDRLKTVAFSTAIVVLSLISGTIMFSALSVDDKSARLSKNSAIESRGFRSNPAGKDVSENSGFVGEVEVR